MRLYTLALLVTALGAPLTAQGFQYTILYTGRTLGYARSPESQLLTPAVPPAPAPNAVAAAYKTLFDAAAGKATGTVLRVGMGDNFSPSLNARSFELANGPRRMKDRYFFENGIWQNAMAASTAAQKAGDTSIPFDNVAQFFIDTGYHALVPGKHDFYYGAERLRDLARFLAAGHVHMLAANLAMSTTVNHPNPRVPERYAHHKYKTDFKGVTVKIPDTVFPYKRQFLVKNAQAVRTAGGLVRRDQLKLAAGAVTIPAIADAQVCWAKAGKNEDPDEVDLPSANGGNCTSLKPQANTSSPDVLYALVDKTLKAGLNHLFCIQFPADPDWTCKPFPVAEPFFEHGTPVASQAAPRRYVVVPGAQPVAIFGVVDPDMLTNIGLLNTTWLNDKPRWDTAVKAAAPDSALEQLLEECETDNECRCASKVLLAQMSYARAAQLGTHLRMKFDVVISEADADHNTGRRDLYEKAPAGREAEKLHPNLVLTPPVPYEDNPELTVDRFVPQVSAANIVKRGAEWELHHEVTAASPEPLNASCTGGSCVKLADVAKAVFAFRKIAPNPGTQTVAEPPSLVVTDLALYAMRRYANADVAILQKRDLFNADRLSDALFPSGALQDRINSIFWKGDFVWTVHVTGAQLKSLLKQSAKFDAADDDPLSTELERNRGLITLGLYANTNDPQTFYVNGARLDDAGLYAVATTDYLGLGDTGYADLATPAVPPPLRLKDFHSMRPLAGVICGEIASIPAYKGIPCDDERLGANYFDPTSQVPADTTPGMNTTRQYATFFKDFVNPSVPSRTREGNAQQRHFFMLSLESGDFSFNAVMLRNGPAMPTTFTGVSAPGVTSKGTSTVGEDHKLRGTYDFRTGTFYLLSDSAFQRTKTTSSFIPSTTSNLYGFESGGTWRWPVNSTRPSWFAFQYSARFEGQFTQPDPAQITLKPLTTPPTTLAIPAPQTSTIYGRAGARADFADTYIELGMEQVDSRHVLSQYVFTVGGTPLYCQPSAQLQFACGTDPALNNGNNTTAIDKAFPQGLPLQAAIQTADYLTGGAYFNFNIKLPLWSRQDPSGSDISYYFTLSNKGDWYFNSHNDTNVQTRYLDKLTPSLTIPLYGKITISPKVDILFYENKVNRNHFRSLQPAIALSYTFKWREGMRFYRALKYGAITTTPPPAPGGK